MSLRDAYGNPIRPSESIRFGLALVATDEKAKRKKRKSDTYVGKWISGTGLGGGEGGGGYEMAYTPTAAGSFKLYLWYETRNDPGDRVEDAQGKRPRKWTRVQLPGTPLKVVCKAGKAHALSSAIRVLCSGGDSAGAEEAGEASAEGKGLRDLLASVHDGESPIVPAGGSILIRPQVCDKYGNETTPPESSSQADADAKGDGAGLVAYIITPSGATHHLTLKEAAKADSKSGAIAPPSEYSYEPKAAGTAKGSIRAYALHVAVGGAQLGNSPVPVQGLEPWDSPAPCLPRAFRSLRSLAPCARLLPALACSLRSPAPCARLLPALACSLRSPALTSPPSEFFSSGSRSTFGA